MNAVDVWKNVHRPSTALLETRHVYHVTPTVCVPSIERLGCDPIFANGAQKVTWWCEKEALLWAIAHISAYKSISVDQLSILTGRYWRGALSATKSAKVYTCRFVSFPHKIYPAHEAFKWFNPDGSFANG